MSIIESLAPVTVGGLIAICGGIIPKLVEAWLLNKKTKQERRQQLYEKALRLTYEFADWFDDFYRAQVFDQPRSERLNPEAELSVMVKLYLPQIAMEWDSLRKAAGNFKIWVLGARKKRFQQSGNGPGSSFPPDTVDGFDEAYYSFRQAVVCFEDTLVKLAASPRSKESLPLAAD
jgi:hypothetical protein